MDNVTHRKNPPDQWRVCSAVLQFIPRSPRMPNSGFTLISYHNQPITSHAFLTFNPDRVN